MVLVTGTVVVVTTTGETVMVTALVVETRPEASAIFAVIVCPPTDGVYVIAYGATESDPTMVAPSYTSTRATIPSASVALIVTVVGACTNAAPLSGAVIVPVGATVIAPAPTRTILPTEGTPRESTSNSW